MAKSSRIFSKCEECGSITTHYKSCTTKKNYCVCGKHISRQNIRCYDCYLLYVSRNYRKAIRRNRKKCSDCNKTKSLNNFHPKNRIKKTYFSICKKCYRKRVLNNSLLRKYGITLKQYKRLVKRGGGLCDICGDSPKGRWSKLNIDHDHRTGKVRGLLCHTCNTGLGMFMDNSKTIKKAARYLRINS